MGFEIMIQWLSACRCYSKLWEYLIDGDEGSERSRGQQRKKYECVFAQKSRASGLQLNEEA